MWLWQWWYRGGCGYGHCDFACGHYDCGVVLVVGYVFTLTDLSSARLLKTTDISIVSLQDTKNPTKNPKQTKRRGFSRLSGLGWL